MLPFCALSFREGGLLNSPHAKASFNKKASADDSTRDEMTVRILFFYFHTSHEISCPAPSYESYSFRNLMGLLLTMQIKFTKNKTKNSSSLSLTPLA